MLPKGQPAFFLAEDTGDTSGGESARTRPASVASSADSWGTCDEEPSSSSGGGGGFATLRSAPAVGAQVEQDSSPAASLGTGARPPAHPVRGSPASTPPASSRTSVVSFRTAWSTADDSSALRASPTASPRRSRPGAYKRASVASVLSGFSLPEEPGGAAAADDASNHPHYHHHYSPPPMVGEVETVASFLFPSCDSPRELSRAHDGLSSAAASSSIVFPRTADSRPTSPTPVRPTSTTSASGVVLGGGSGGGKNARSSLAGAGAGNPARFGRTVSFPSLAHPSHLHGPQQQQQQQQQQQNGLQPASSAAVPLASTSVSTFRPGHTSPSPFSGAPHRSLSQSSSKLGVRTLVRSKTVSLTGGPEPGPGPRWGPGARAARFAAAAGDGEPERAQRRLEKKRKVVREIVESERVYVAGLGVVIEHFLQPLLASAELPNPLLPKKTVYDLFSSVVDVHAFSTAFLGALEAELEPRPEEAVGLSSASAASTPKAQVSGLDGLRSPAKRAGWEGAPDEGERTEELDSPPRRPVARPVSLPSTPATDGTPRARPSVALPSTPAPSPAQIVHVLAKHMPFLSLYHPFISAYPASSALLARLRKDKAHERFAGWLAERERSEVCKRLRLGDWLLSVVQRVPRYLLLIKDLMSCTPEDDPEHDDLLKVMALVDNVTATLNSRLHDIAATQQLIGLHRSFTNIPPGFSLVVPGRRLLKQGDLSKVCRRKAEDRSFWLFSDLIVYGTTAASASLTASKSMVSLSTWIGLPAFPSSRSGSLDVNGPSSSAAAAGSRMVPALDAEGDKGRFTFHRAIRLEELTVVGTADGRKNEHSFELLSPDKSFAVIASCREEKDAWITTIREAKAQLLANLRTLNTAEEHTMRRHRRRSLQAMPFADPSSSASRALASLPEGIVGPSRGTRRVSVDSPSAAAATGARASAPQGPTTVESFIAAVWVPDTRAEKCMRCQEPFSVWRRRHHCRMCGLLCCHACSSKSVQINDSTDPTSSAQGVRACDPCFDSLFPSLRSPRGARDSARPTSSADRPSSAHSASSNSHDSPPTPTDSPAPLPSGTDDDCGGCNVLEQRGRSPASAPTIAGGGRIVSGSKSGTAIDVEPPTPLESPPAVRPAAQVGAGSYFARRGRAGSDAAAAARATGLGTLKPSAARASILPFGARSSSAVASADTSTAHSTTTATATALGTLRAKSPRPVSPDAAGARPSFVRAPAQRARLLSAANDRFSVFVGGGAGGADWEGKGEMVKLTSERDRRESGERWGDASLRSGEAAGHLRRVLQGGGGGSGT